MIKKNPIESFSRDLWQSRAGDILLHKPAPPSPSRCAHATTTIPTILVTIIIQIIQQCPSPNNHNCHPSISWCGLCLFSWRIFIRVIVTIMMKILLKNVIKNTISNYGSYLLVVSRLNNEVQLVKTKNIVQFVDGFPSHRINILWNLNLIQLIGNLSKTT